MLGVSEKTIRRRIAKGQMQATKGKTPQGFIYLIDINDNNHNLSKKSSDDKHEEIIGKNESNILDLELLKKQFEIKDEQIESQKEQIASQINQINELYKIIPKLQSDIIKISEKSSWWKFWVA